MLFPQWGQSQAREAAERTAREAAERSAREMAHTARQAAERAQALQEAAERVARELAERARAGLVENEQHERQRTLRPVQRGKRLRLLNLSPSPPTFKGSTRRNANDSETRDRGNALLGVPDSEGGFAVPS